MWKNKSIPYTGKDIADKRWRHPNSEIVTYVLLSKWTKHDQ